MSEQDNLRTLAKHLPPVQPPDSVWTRIEAGLDEARVAQVPDLRRPLFRFAFASLAAALAIAAALYWYDSRKPVAHWDVVRLDGAPSVGAQPIANAASIREGEWLQTDARSRAQIKVGDIGTVDVEPNTRVRVTVARPNEHRLTLARGDISATVSAPPRLFFVDSPSSTAVDLGCAYTMHVDDSGAGLLRVTLGWVSLEWGGRESLVPAGANCRTRKRIGPGTPYFEDASTPLQQALANFDFGGAPSLGTVLNEARLRDTLTLWHLLSRTDATQRVQVLDRIIALTPLPDGVSRDQILSLDRASLEKLKDELAWKW